MSQMWQKCHVLFALSLKRGIFVCLFFKFFRLSFFFVFSSRSFIVVNVVKSMCRANIVDRCQFHQHFTCAFFVQKCFFANCSSRKAAKALSYGKRTPKMLIKLTPERRQNHFLSFEALHNIQIEILLKFLFFIIIFYFSILFSMLELEL